MKILAIIGLIYLPTTIVTVRFPFGGLENETRNINSTSTLELLFNTVYSSGRKRQDTNINTSMDHFCGLGSFDCPHLWCMVGLRTISILNLELGKDRPILSVLPDDVPAPNPRGWDAVDRSRVRAWVAD